MSIESKGSNINNTLSDEIEINYHYSSKSKIYYGVHPINIIRDGKRIQVSAKFDTGAKSSSIDLEIAEKLGLSPELIESYKELDKIDVPRDISKVDLKNLEARLTEEYSKKHPDVSAVKVTKSASGFSVRPYVRLILEFGGRYISTEVNLRDRSGLSCDMLIGLGDML